jgi:hypothetical protein
MWQGRTSLCSCSDYASRLYTRLAKNWIFSNLPVLTPPGEHTDNPTFQAVGVDVRTDQYQLRDCSRLRGLLVMPPF